MFPWFNIIVTGPDNKLEFLLGAVHETALREMLQSAYHDDETAKQALTLDRIDSVQNLSFRRMGSGEHYKLTRAEAEMNRKVEELQRAFAARGKAR